MEEAIFKYSSVKVKEGGLSMPRKKPRQRSNAEEEGDLPLSLPLLRQMKLPQLKGLLKEHGLPVTGNKTNMVPPRHNEKNKNVQFFFFFCHQIQFVVFFFFLGI